MNLLNHRYDGRMDPRWVRFFRIPLKGESLELGSFEGNETKESSYPGTGITL